MIMSLWLGREPCETCSQGLGQGKLDGQTREKAYAVGT